MLEGKRIIFIDSRYHFFDDRDTRVEFIFFIAFSNGSEMVLATLVTRFGTILMKNVLRMLDIWYSFLLIFHLHSM